MVRIPSTRAVRPATIACRPIPAFSSPLPFPSPAPPSSNQSIPVVRPFTSTPAPEVTNKPNQPGPEIVRSGTSSTPATTLRPVSLRSFPATSISNREHRRARQPLPPRPPPHQQQQQQHDNTLLTLAIETSCDDTCVAILEKRTSPPRRFTSTTASSSPLGRRDRPLATLHFNERVTAPDTGHGGIHPVEALASHNAKLAGLVERSLRSLPDVSEREESGGMGGEDVGLRDTGRVLVTRDGSLKRKPDFISVTRGPGMRSNLSCGLNVAKGLSVAWQVPLLGVHHMQAHALTPRLVHALESTTDSSSGGGGKVAPEFPFLTLLVSGGHTMLLYSTGLVSHKIVATTYDVAIGDALDKCGRLLLPDEIKEKANDTSYAKHLSTWAFPKPEAFRSWPVARARADEIDKLPNKFGWLIRTPLASTRDLRFSFASIASDAERLYKSRDGINWSADERLLMARTVLGTAFEHLGSRIVIALEWLRNERTRIPTLVVSGGVAANDFLQYLLRSMLDVRGFRDIELVFPPVALCTDNAAMIAWTGMEMFEAGYRSGLDIDAVRKWSMDAKSEDGGIVGVGGWAQRATEVSVLVQ